MSQLGLMVAVSMLVGLASAGVIWFGTDLSNKVMRVLKIKMHERKLKKEAEAEAEKEKKGDDEE